MLYIIHIYTYIHTYNNNQTTDINSYSNTTNQTNQYEQNKNFILQEKIKQFKNLRNVKYGNRKYE